MKYITTTTEDGEKEIFTFPDSVQHKLMAESVSAIRDQDFGNWKRIRRTAISAGFVENGKCVGRSESLNLQSNPLDTLLLGLASQ